MDLQKQRRIIKNRCHVEQRDFNLFKEKKGERRVR